MYYFIIHLFLKNNCYWSYDYLDHFADTIISLPSFDKLAS